MFLFKMPYHYRLADCTERVGFALEPIVQLKLVGVRGVVGSWRGRCRASKTMTLFLKLVFSDNACDLSPFVGGHVMPIP